MDNKLYTNSHNLVTLDALKEDTDSSYVNNATVTCTLYDSLGVAVTGATWPLTLTYVAASNGKYQAKITSAAVLTAGDIYTLKIDAVGSLSTKHWEVQMFAAADGG